MIDKLEAEAAKFTQYKEAEVSKTNAAAEFVIDALNNNTIRSNIDKDIGDMLYKILPSFNTKKNSDAEGFVVGKRPGQKFAAYKYEAPSRVAYYSSDQLFWGFQQAHVNLITNKDKRDIGQDFYNLINAIRTKAPQRDVELATDINIPTIKACRWSIDSNIYTRHATSTEYVIAGESGEATVNAITLTLPAVMSPVTHISSAHDAKKSRASSELQINVKASLVGRHHETLTISGSGITPLDLYRSRLMYGLGNNVQDCAIDGWSIILKNQELQDKIKEWMEWQSLATKSYNFLMKKYSKELFFHML